MKDALGTDLSAGDYVFYSVEGTPRIARLWKIVEKYDGNSIRPLFGYVVMTACANWWSDKRWQVLGCQHQRHHVTRQAMARGKICAVRIDPEQIPQEALDQLAKA